MRKPKSSGDEKEIKSFLAKSHRTSKERQVKERLTKDTIIMLGCIIAILHLIVLIIMYGMSIVMVRRIVISNNPIYICVASITPIILWLASTSTEYWNFYNRKIFLLYVVIINTLLVLLQPLYSAAWRAIVPLVFKIEITAAMTQGMVILLAQVLLVAVLIAVIWIAFGILRPILLSEQAIVKVKRFKITHHVDTREDKEYLYDLRIAKKLENAQDIVIKYRDRFTHLFINGASGTGKTSSVFLPAILSDFTQKLYNASKRIPKIVSMLLQKKAYVEGPLSEFNEYKVRPKKEYEEEFRELYRKYPDCGTTVLAPNNSALIDIIKLAGARKIKVNVLDPAEETDYSKFKNVIKVGMNPFYIPLGLSEHVRSVRIDDAASVFAEVLVAVNERSGATEVYFSDITKAVTTNVAKVCMLARNIQGLQTDIVEIQQCITNFDAIRKFVKTIEDELHIVVEVNNSKKDKANNGSFTGEDLFKYASAEDAVRIKEESLNSPYYQVLLFVKTELLGEGREKMFDQTRGLRNLINKFLSDPRIRSVLTATDDQRLDFDRMLAENEITVVNSSLAFGEEKSTALGLFFILTQKISVLRRPGRESDRSPHFIWIDEASQYMHPAFEEFVTLYRQYKVGVTFAVQSQSQFEKNSTTKYLKGIFMTVGTHFAFGRLSPDEMKTYSKMAGTTEVDVAQRSVTETSIFEENPTKSYSERVTPTLKNNIEESDLRQLDFQEVTVLTVDNGRVLEGVLAKVAFLKKDAYNPVNVMSVEWDKLKEHVEIVEKEENERYDKDTPPIERMNIENRNKKISHVGTTEELLQQTTVEKVKDYGVQKLTEKPKPYNTKATPTKTRESVVESSEKRRLHSETVFNRDEAAEFEKIRLEHMNKLKRENMDDNTTGNVHANPSSMSPLDNTEKEEEVVLSLYDLFNEE